MNDPADGSASGSTARRVTQAALVLACVAAGAFCIGLRAANAWTLWITESAVPFVVVAWLFARLRLPIWTTVPLVGAAFVACGAAYAAGVLVGAEASVGVMVSSEASTAVEAAIVAAALVVWELAARRAELPARAVAAAAVATATAALGYATWVGDGEAVLALSCVVIAGTIMWLDRAAIRAWPWLATAATVAVLVGAGALHGLPDRVSANPRAPIGG